MSNRKPTFTADWLKKPFAVMSARERSAVMAHPPVYHHLVELGKQWPDDTPFAGNHINQALMNCINQPGLMGLYDWAIQPDLIEAVAATCTANDWGDSNSNYLSDRAWLNTGNRLYPWRPIWEKDDKSEVSLYANLVDLFRNRRTTVRTGRFLRALLNGSGDDNTVQDMVQYIIAGHLPIKLAVTAADIRTLYENGPHSCMKGFRSFTHHPAEVYCYPHERETLDDEYSNGVAVAYLGQLDNAKARALVRHKADGSKLHGRIYGDDQLREVLKQNGYQSDDRLLDDAKMWLYESGYEILCPYFDYYGYGTAHNNEYFTVSRHSGDFDVQITSGWTGDGEDMVTCECCGDRVEENDAYYQDDQHWCHACFHDNFTEAIGGRGMYGTYRVFVRSEDVVEIGNEFYTDGYASEIASPCDSCGEWTLHDDSHRIEDDGDYCESCYLVRCDYLDLIRCERCGEHTNRDEDECEHCDWPLNIPADRTPSPYQVPMGEVLERNGSEPRPMMDEPVWIINGYEHIRGPRIWITDEVQAAISVTNLRTMQGANIFVTSEGVCRCDFCQGIARHLPELRDYIRHHLGAS